MLLRPGEAFSFERVLESQRRLSSLGIFERVSDLRARPEPRAAARRGGERAGGAAHQLVLGHRLLRAGPPARQRRGHAPQPRRPRPHGLRLRARQLPRQPLPAQPARAVALRPQARLVPDRLLGGGGPHQLRLQPQGRHRAGRPRARLAHQPDPALPVPGHERLQHRGLARRDRPPVPDLRRLGPLGLGRLRHARRPARAAARASSWAPTCSCRSTRSAARATCAASSRPPASAGCAPTSCSCSRGASASPRPSPTRRRSCRCPSASSRAATTGPRGFPVDSVGPKVVGTRRDALPDGRQRAPAGRRRDALQPEPLVPARELPRHRQRLPRGARRRAHGPALERRAGRALPHPDRPDPARLGLRARPRSRARRARASTSRSGMRSSETPPARGGVALSVRFRSPAVRRLPRLRRLAARRRRSRSPSRSRQRRHDRARRRRRRRAAAAALGRARPGARARARARRRRSRRCDRRAADVPGGVAAAAGGGARGGGAAGARRARSSAGPSCASAVPAAGPAPARAAARSRS